MRSPLLISILMAGTISACGQPLAPGMSGSGGAGSGEMGTGGSGSCGALCGSGCVDVTSDNSNCGSCGNACATGQTCSNGSCAAAMLGCAMSDPPATAEIATFSGDGGIAPFFGVFTYGAAPQPTYTISGGVLNAVDNIEIGPTSEYQGFGLYFNGNAAGTDCVDASRYTGISFSLSGSLLGAGCTMQFAINDSAHIPNLPDVTDPKAAGPAGSYAPELSIPGAELTAAPTTIMVPFAGIDAPVGGSPPIPVDPTKLVGVQWQMSTPVASSDQVTDCIWNVNVSNVRFYQ